MADDPARELARIRSRVRHLGLTIRSRAATRGSPRRVYSVLDRATGRVVYSGAEDLVELKTRLWWILRQRRLGSDRVAAPGRVATPRCPACGTPRSGFFRYCRGCGHDWEVGHPSAPPIAASGPTYLVRPDDAGADVFPTLPARLAEIRLPAAPAARPVAPAEQAVEQAHAADAPTPTRPRLRDWILDARSDADRIVLAIVLIGLLSGAVVAVIAVLMQR